MKILFVCPRFYPSIGGVEKHSYEVVSELLKLGHRVSIVTEFSPKNQHITKKTYQSRGKSDRPSLDLELGVKSIQTMHFEAGNAKIFALNFGKNDWYKKFRIWAQMMRMSEIFSDVDVVHCHDVFFWYIPLRFMYPFKKVFVTFHGHETKFPPTLKAKAIRKVSEVLSFGNICVGRYIEKWYGAKADLISYGGIRPHGKIPNISKNKNKRKIKITFLGRLDNDNAINVYVDALKILKKRGIKFELTVCGSGKLDKSIKTYGKVLGFVKDPSKYIKNCDIFFASSYLSMLEGLLYKRPVFAAYNNDLKKDYLGMSPFRDFVYTVSNGQLLADKIAEYKYDTRISRGFSWARRQTWLSVANLYIKLWRQ